MKQTIRPILGCALVFLVLWAALELMERFPGVS